ncbi:MAG: ASKHA domain-containing protein [Candidatus Heimdallarchaeota archaeon]
MENANEEIILDFEPISRRFYYTKHKSLYEMLLDSGIRIRSLCGGAGTCGKCKILVQEGKNYLDPPTESEFKFISKNEIKNGWRLACQTKINISKIQEIQGKNKPQFRIFLPDDLLVEDFKILTTGINKGVKINPNIKKLFIKVDKPSLEKPIPDLERIISVLKALNNELKNTNIAIDYDILKQIQELLNKGNNEITLTIYDNIRIINCEVGNTTDTNFGIAFDIGTTTIVGYLLNLNNGKIYSVASSLNPQTAFGEDVVSRISYIKDNKDGLQKLNSIVIDKLNNIIDKTASNAKIAPSQINEATIVGNSVMHHIFLGFNPTSIGLSPYVPIVQQGLNFNSRKLNLKISETGNVYTLPLIAGFVGADTMGVILSSEIDKETELTLAIDIGTNGEIILGNKDVLATGSCAAGSALEGAHIKDGMRAASGAIDSIEIDPTDLGISYTTIKNKEPIGICGSGLIDLVAEMLRTKIITRSGNFNKNLIKSNNFYKKENVYEFIIVEKDETSTGKSISITQNDIREIQMAKAAFYSGAKLILNYLKRISDINNQISQIFLAGAFGNYIKKENAKFIGMIPDLPNEKIFQIGNAAGIGAQICLLDKELRDKAQNLLNNINYVEIALEKDFQTEYAQAMYFPHVNLDYFPSLKEYQNIPKR